MNIGIDIDDTITDTFDYLMPYVAEFFETDIEYLKRNNISYSNLPDEWKKREIDFAKKYYDKVVIGIPTKQHVCEYISKIKSLGHNIYIITARDNRLYKNAYKKTEEQLSKNNIYYDKLFCTFDKAEICKNEHIDIMIDDSIYNCEEVSKVGTQALLFNNKININIDVEFKRMNNWQQVYEYINHIGRIRD